MNMKHPVVTELRSKALPEEPEGFHLALALDLGLPTQVRHEATPQPLLGLLTEHVKHYVYVSLSKLKNI